MPLQPMVSGRRHMVSAGHWLATEAGHAVLEAGGNAVDAAVAAGIALGVLHCDQVQWSGVAPMVIHLRETGEVVTISRPRLVAARPAVDGSSGEHGGAIPRGLLRTVVPAAPDAWILALARYGPMSFGEVASSAIRYAREGFAVHPVMAHFIAKFADQYRLWPQNAAVFLPGGRRPRKATSSSRPTSPAPCSTWSTRRRPRGRPRRRAGGGARRLLPRRPRRRDGALPRRKGWLADARGPGRVPLRRRAAGAPRRSHGTEVYCLRPLVPGPGAAAVPGAARGATSAALGHNSPDYVPPWPRR